ncbi:MAG TPA: GntR family transcriptional regulator [Phototrophicaceae bacterium]|nr:GntR family transcriptional regulator [Phototrophicaceae bacterium]
MKNRSEIGASVADQVWQRLRLEIIHGILPPGTRLLELELAEEMGVSQGTIREALKRLETDALVERKARTASYVTPILLDEMHELFSIRSLVESAAIRRTVQHITPQQCEELAEMVDLMREAAAKSDLALLVDYDLQFHQRICEWAASITLLRTWMPLYSQIQRFIVQTHPRYFADLKEIADTHDGIVAVLRENNPEAASRTIQEHIMLIWSRIGSEHR